MPCITYFESVVKLTIHGSFKAFNPSIAAFNSILLLVVFNSPPKYSFETFSYSISTPQPPSPGFPLHAPSV